MVVGLAEDVSIGGRCITLPSSETAVTLVRGDVAAGLIGVIGSTLLRSVIIMGGLYVVGERAHLIRNALGASTAIELFVLAWVARKNAEASAASPQPARTP
jgi:hypothetical protein